MTEQKSPLEQALDLVFYAPVGLALTAREELPRLIEKGRAAGLQPGGDGPDDRPVRRHPGPARGQQGRQAGRTTPWPALGIIPGPARPAASTCGAGRAGGRVLARAGDPTDGRICAGRAVVGRPRRRPTAPAPAAPVASANGKPVAAEPARSSDGLAIPGYDSLSASQVVQRLAGLAPAELEAVRDYEASTRGRRTILNRIAQLQTGSA